MAEVEKLKNKIMVLCDCGAIHKITKDEESGELILSSTFKQKPTETPKPKEEENGKKKEKSATDFF